MQKLDFKKQDKALYTAKAGSFALIDVPEMAFLMIDGAGDPNSDPAYARAVGALYALSYGLKFHGKARGLDHVVPPLEGLWWANDMASFETGDKAQWKWRMMIRQPDWVNAAELAAVLEATQAKMVKKKDAPTDAATLGNVRLERFAEGLSVQTLHLGPYDEEAPLLRELHESYLPQQGLHPHGLHHEIYLNDPSRVAPEKLRTILRQPVGRI